MKLRAPNYYKKFHCIADKCKDSCCSAGWEINIDDKTLKYYENVQGEFGNKLRANISNNSDNTGKCFMLNNKNNCPFLNNQKLCEIYINLGEDKLCNICTEHPRFYEWFNDVKEVGIGLCCEEVARIILSETDFFGTYDVEIPHEECDDYSNEVYSYLLKARTKIINYINSCPSSHLFSCIQNILWYCNVIQQNIDSNLLDDEDIIEIKKYNTADVINIFEFLLTLEHNDKNWHSYLQNCINLYSTYADELSNFEASNPLVLQYLKNILIYFIWRYFLKGVFDEEIISKISFAAISISVLRVLFFCKWLNNGNLTLEDCVDIAKKYSEEIEYNEANMEKLFDACYELNYFSIENLISLF